jgi:endo-1,4-beta-mannosidase
MTDVAKLRDGHFAIGDSIYTARGVNYYPSKYPWRRFLTESDSDTVRDELLLLHTAGFNTLRIFLWNAALFSCDGRGIIPNPEGFGRLDFVIQEAAAQGFHLVMTFNDMPGDDIYSNPAHLQTQTRLIVERYKNEAAILAWDVRNEGDIDYGSNDTFGRGKFTKDNVLDWLKQTTDAVRSLDKKHLITAGWLKDSEATAPDVDFLSFHHWDDAGKLHERINGMRATGVNKPILLEEFGYSTLRMSPEDQSRTLAEVIQASDAENLLGWLIWTAFDFPLDATCIRPACPSQDNAEHHFGLWLPDYTPKPAVEMLLQR